MKNVNKVLLSSLIISLAAVVVGCNSGSSSSSGPAGPNINTLTVPESFTATVTLGTGSPVLWNATLGMAVPSASGYQVVALPADVTAAINSAGPANAVISGSANDTLVISLPTVTYAVSNLLTSSSKVASSSVESYPVTSTNILSDAIQIESIPALMVPAGLVYGNTSGGLVITTPNNGDTAGSTYEVPTTGCGLLLGESVTQLTPTVYNGINYVGLGGSGGTVCVLQGNAASWTNLSESAANTGRYAPNTINNLGFFSSGNSLLGFWTVESAAAVQNTVYQVNGIYTNSGYLGQAFYNISTNGQQKGNSTSTLTVVNAPSVITSTVTDVNGNLWAGSTNGQVYVLRTGAGGQWTNAQIAGVTGSTYVWPTGSTGVSVTNTTNNQVSSAQ